MSANCRAWRTSSSIRVVPLVSTATGLSVQRLIWRRMVLNSRCRVGSPLAVTVSTSTAAKRSGAAQKVVISARISRVGAYRPRRLTRAAVGSTSQ